MSGTVEALAKGDLHAKRGQLRRRTEHFLKLELSAARQPLNKWWRCGRDARGELLHLLTPTADTEPAPSVPKPYADAHANAADVLGQLRGREAATALPMDGTYSLLAPLTARTWYPTNRHGLLDQTP